MQEVVLTQTSLEALSTNDKLLRLYGYWKSKRKQRQFPSRNDIDPLEFSFAISVVSLVDVTENPRKFRYRLVSTTLTNRLGYEMTNKWVDDIPEADVRAYVQHFYNSAVEFRAPFYEKSERVFDHRIWKHEALVLPLSGDGSVIDMLLVYRETYDPKYAF